jgi:hypothetical protein
MADFQITDKNGQAIQFRLYEQESPVTSKAFLQILPFTRTFYHARVSGQEIWIDDAPPLDIIQENASVFIEPGEVVIGPEKAGRAKTANCFGIYYGEGKGLDACNIFARVLDEDREKLAEFGNRIWKEGAMELTVARIS